MPADQPSAVPSTAPSAERLRRRGNRIAAAFLVFALVLVGVGAWLLADSQSKDREQLETRFANGAGVASAVLDGLFGSITQQTQRLSQQFSGPVPPEALDAYVEQQQSAYALMLDGDG